MIENPNVICNDCGFGKQNKELKDKCERLEKQLLEIKDAYIDLITQDEYGSYYIEEAKDFVDIVGRILKESGLLQELEK